MATRIVRDPRRAGLFAGGLVPAATAALLLLGGCGTTPAGTASGKTPPPGTATGGQTAPGTPAVSRIPQATTFSTVSGAPRDATPDGATDGLVVHPERAVPVFDRPGGRPIATLPTEQLGAPTWVPVVESSGGWRRVLLPSRPNGSSGWIPGGGLRAAHTPYTVRVDLAHRRLTLFRSAKETGRWTVAIGDAKTPTPPGRTFLMATLAPARRTPSPIVLPLGTHSATLDTFGGGPGTVALHGWPDASVFGKAVTHGCVRVPKDALRALSRVPLGSLVFITG